MVSKRILIIAFILLTTPILTAQETGGAVSVVSNPSGAEVVLKGNVTVAGVSPVNFIQNLEGRYKLQVKKFGYETHKSDVFLQAGRGMSLNVELKPKTRFKALSRSFFIPGWGQVYTDQKLKGGILFALTAGACVSFFMADADFRDKRDYLDDLQDEYNQSSSFEDKQRLYPELISAKKDAFDAESARRITIGVTAAAWALNIIDLLFYFPDHSGSLIVNSLTIKPDLEQGGGQIVLSHRF